MAEMDRSLPDHEPVDETACSSTRVRRDPAQKDILCRDALRTLRHEKETIEQAADVCQGMEGVQRVSQVYVSLEHVCPRLQERVQLGHAQAVLRCPTSQQGRGEADVDDRGARGRLHACYLVA